MGYDYPNSDMPGKSEGEQLFSEEPQPDNRPVDIDGSRRYFCGEVDTLRDDHYDTHEPGGIEAEIDIPPRTLQGMVDIGFGRAQGPCH